MALSRPEVRTGLGCNLPEGARGNGWDFRKGTYGLGLRILRAGLSPGVVQDSKQQATPGFGLRREGVSRGPLTTSPPLSPTWPKSHGIAALRQPDARFSFVEFAGHHTLRTDTHSVSLLL